MDRGAWWAKVYRLMCIADAHCILVREGGGQIETQNFMSNFSCPAFKYKFYLIKFNQAYGAKLQFRVSTVRGESNLEQTPSMWDLL